MDSIHIGLISVLAILVLIYAGMYVPVVLGLVSFVGVWAVKGNIAIAIKLLALAASKTIGDYVFGVIPLFVLMGLLVSVAQIGADTFLVANQAFRRVRAGLGHATVAANAIFAAITGISIASAAVFTRIAVPEMLRYGYSPRFAVGVVAGSSVLGMLIPPSLLLIIYALITELSVGDMFLAAVIPGLLLSGAYIVAIMVMSRLTPGFVGRDALARIDEIRKHGQDDLLSGVDIVKKMAPIVILVALVIGGIYLGWFTPTEAGAVGALGALVLALAKRRLDGKQFWRVLIETGHITAAICLLIISASMYSRMLGLSGIAGELGDWVEAAELSLWTLLVLYIVILLILGTLLDSVSIMLITVPLFMPMLDVYDVNMVWFGIITVITVEIGLLTPPLGISAYVIKSTLDDDRITLFDIFAGAAPFALIMLLVTFLIVLFPSLSLYLLG